MVSNLLLGQDLMTRIDERSDKGYSTQVYVCAVNGCNENGRRKSSHNQAHEA